MLSGRFQIFMKAAALVSAAMRFFPSQWIRAGVERRVSGVEGEEVVCEFRSAAGEDFLQPSTRVRIRQERSISSTAPADCAEEEDFRPTKHSNFDIKASGLVQKNRSHRKNGKQTKNSGGKQKRKLTTDFHGFSQIERNRGPDIPRLPTQKGN